MKYIEFDTQAGTLGYDLYPDLGTATLSAYRGRDVAISIPDKIEVGEAWFVVNRIKNKAFLSNKNLREIVVPSSVANIDDWAFARCSNLERISVSRDTELGNGVFKDCEKLSQVLIGEEDSERMQDVSFLLASVIPLLDDKYLFNLKEAGSTEWIENWDKKMDVILNTPDDEGFIALLACGEEDYEGRDNTLDGYLSNSRRRKVHICMLRLLHSSDLSEDRRQRLVEYLYNHRAGMVYSLNAFDAGNGYSDGYMGRTSINGTRSDVDLYVAAAVNSSLPNQAGHEDDIKPMEESWNVVLEEHGDEEEYYELLFNCGCIDIHNREQMLSDMGEHHARMKAYLLRLDLSGNASDEGTSASKIDDFFGSLDL